LLRNIWFVEKIFLPEFSCFHVNEKIFFSSLALKIVSRSAAQLSSCFVQISFIYFVAFEAEAFKFRDHGESSEKSFLMAAIAWNGFCVTSCVFTGNFERLDVSGHSHPPSSRADSRDCQAHKSGVAKVNRRETLVATVE
jgi:hypothetical protein